MEQVHDARQLEAEQGLSKIDFFNKYGFVIMDSKVSLTAEDWLASDGMKSQSDIKSIEGFQDDNNVPTPANTVYAKQLQPLVKQLVPTATQFFPPSRGVHRSRWLRSLRCSRSLRFSLR